MFLPTKGFIYHYPQIHNENNENNIAISPYGALSVLIALGEGLQGDAVREIQHFGHLPNDISIIRIGLRDIHRHLKSYFIPREGFLAGLTLNHENVTLRPEYEEILKFYGYDATAFNYALYPEPQTTEKPTPTTTEKTSPMSTTLSPTTEEVTSKRVTSEDVTTVGGDAREVTTTKKPIPTTITEKTSPMTNHIHLLQKR
ncbi:hypothetical protein JTB14_009560 [Gonioctena quinquepunctata]|nr:hypothetical protein JTB14_009560 [Gonioctena quinquepunctata]